MNNRKEVLLKTSSVSLALHLLDLALLLLNGLEQVVLSPSSFLQLAVQSLHVLLLLLVDEGELALHVVDLPRAQQL